MNRSSQRRRGRRDQEARKALAPLVASGQAICWRCDQPIAPDDEWDAGHVVSLGEGGHPDGERRPEHRRGCNRSAGGHLAQQLRSTRRVDRSRFLG